MGRSGVVLPNTILLFHSILRLQFDSIDLLLIIKLLYVSLADVEVHFKHGVDYVAVVLEEVRVQDVGQLQALDDVLADLEHLLEGVNALQEQLAVVNYYFEFFALSLLILLLGKQTEAQLSGCELLFVIEGFLVPRRP